MASRRRVVSAPSSAAIASPRDFGGSGNASLAAAVSAAARSTITLLRREIAMFWKSAAAILALLVTNLAFAADSANPDYHNLYAYSLRKGGSAEMDLVFKHYNEALRLDPGHRGAHEYIGEAYLMVGNVAKAKERSEE